MKRRSLYDFHTNAATAEGEIIQKENTFLINTEINGLTHEMIFIYMIFIVMMTFLLITTFASEDTYQCGVIRRLFELMIIISISFSVPYFIIRTTVKRMKKSLQKDLFTIE